MKNLENPKEWLVDEPAAKIVQQIFDMCVAGFGPTQIAKKLKSAKVMTPTEYFNSIGRNCGKLPAVPYNRCSAMVADILSKQEYIGDTVNFRGTTKSFKNKEWCRRLYWTVCSVYSGMCRVSYTNLLKRLWYPSQSTEMASGIRIWKSTTMAQALSESQRQKKWKNCSKSI